MPALSGLWAPRPDRAEPSVVVRPTDIEGRFTMASLLLEFAPLRGLRPTATDGKSHCEKGVPFSGNATHPCKIAATRDRAKSRACSEQEFVAELKNLQVPTTDLSKLAQHLGLEHRLDVI